MSLLESVQLGQSGVDPEDVRVFGNVYLEPPEKKKKNQQNIKRKKKERKYSTSEDNHQDKIIFTLHSDFSNSSSDIKNILRIECK